MSVPITINGVVYQAPSSAADTNWAALQVLLEQALAAAVGPLTWAGVTFGSGWSGTLETAKDSQGRVWLRGYATHSGDPSGLTVCTLAAAQRPTADAYWVLADQASPNTQYANVVASTGAVTIVSGGTGAHIDFAPVNFDTQAF